MYKEIGSEFWDIPVQDKENLVFSNDTKWFVSGRTALDFIIKDIKKKKDVKTVLLPSWCCESMIKPFIDNNIEADFYPVIFDEELKIQINKKADILLRIDYFGYKQNIPSFKGTIIDDVTHSIFRNDITNTNYVFGSLRKWAGFKTGGLAYCKDGFGYEANLKDCSEYYYLRNKAMNEKRQYIGNEIDEKQFLNIYNEAEEMLDNLYECAGNNNDIQSAKHLDVEYIKNKRKENAKRLLNDLKQYAMFKEIKDDDCPLFVPILLEDRDGLRKYLINNNIYCPIHWPISNLHKLSKEEKYIYDHELSIVCDQRYDIEDMNKICDCINKYMNGEIC